MTDHLHDALERQSAAWMKARNEPPRVPWDEDVAPEIYVGEPDADEWVGWRHIPRKDSPTLAELAPDLAPFHPSVEAWFAHWWFLALEGSVDGRMLSLRPNVPGYDPEDFTGEIRRYAAAHGGRLRHVPMGFDNRSSLQVVVDNGSGEVFIEDWENGTFDRIASSLDDLLQRLEFA